MMDHIIADALVAGESQYLEDKLSHLQKFEERIENWDLQGLVFLDYFTAVSIIEQIKQSQTVFFLMMNSNKDFFSKKSILLFYGSIESP